MLNMNELLLMMIEKRASDLHISVGAPPMFRVDGEIVPTPFEKLPADVCQRLIYSLLTESQRQRFEADNELDLAFGIKGVGRIRMNVFRQRGSVAATLRAIPTQFLSFEDLGIPAVVYELMKLQKGLVLVTGPTGSGKSTTLASMVDYLNTNRASHIITIEDPIEFLHFHKKSVVNQREIGHDTNSFIAALKYVLRQDPDVILVGEMRDLETIQSALNIAETGHLVFATLHTSDAPSSVNRIIDVFPPHQQEQVRAQLSFVLKAVFSQMLLPHSSGVGRVLACEVLMVTPAVQNLIRDQKVEQIYLSLQTGAKFGMQTITQSLYSLCSRRQINYQDAINHATDRDELNRMLGKGAPAKV